MNDNEMIKEGFMAIILAVVAAGILTLLAYRPARNIYSLFSGLLAIASICLFMYGIIKNSK